jgi:hypothetical protein
MKKSRSFKASGFDALESRVVLSHAHPAAAMSPGVLHGRNARLVAADFARFQAAFNSSVVPLAQDMQAAEKSGDNWRASYDSQAMSTQINSLVNGLGEQLARQLHKKMFTRIRTLVTGAPSPTTVGLASSRPAPGSLQATLSALPADAVTNPSVVGAIVNTCQSAVIGGNIAPRTRAAFVNFESSFNKTVTPLVQDGKTQQDVNAGIVAAVNSLGTQLAAGLGPGAVSDVQARITGSTGSGSVTLASTATPAPGSLMSVLEAIPSNELYYNWELINDLALAYASSSRSF